jgi:2,4-dienoyl-CoA reductase-like NADH-dependent reductase (Old Yellow Enzyme family)
MSSIFSKVSIRGREVRNRIVFPPIVNFGWSDDRGFVSPKHIKHYEDRARGGVGLIIVEATCVQPEGRIFSYQLGAWSDAHVEGLSKIADACHRHGAATLLQIHHAGLGSRKGLSGRVVGPSAPADIEHSHALTIDEIQRLKEDFAEAAVRAQRAGFDGVELHGAHGYLLNQFANSAINQRTDEYGGSITGYIKLSVDIIRRIRCRVSDQFIVGYRMGANSPTLGDGIEIARILDREDIDYLHVSHGGEKGVMPEVPSGFGYNWIVYAGTEVKKHVGKPVIVVNEIKTPERAEWLVAQGMADMVAIGRDICTDSEWVNKAMRNEKINYCIQCKPWCKRFGRVESCPLFVHNQ